MIGKKSKRIFLAGENNREIDSKLLLFLVLEISASSFEADMTLSFCSPESNILPQILSKGANFLIVICAIILSPKISFYANNSGEIIKRFFLVRQPHTKSQKTFINMTSNLKNLADDLPKVSVHSDVTIEQQIAEFYELI